jgi:hypothetical protein
MSDRGGFAIAAEFPAVNSVLHGFIEYIAQLSAHDTDALEDSIDTVNFRELVKELDGF